MKKFFTYLTVLLVIATTTATAQTCGTWYVSPTGSGTAGTPANPVSLDYALQNVTPGRDYIKMLAGTYSYTNKLNLVSNVTVEGGYQVNGTDWVLSSNSASTIEIDPPVEFATVNSVTVGHYIGVEANNLSNFTLRNLTFNVLMAGASGTTFGRGRSVYGIYISNSTGYEISRVSVNTGAGSNGDDGAAPSGSGGGGAGGNGGNGGNGSDGCSNSSPGIAGIAGSGGAIPGTGGPGRDPDCNGLGCNGDQLTGNPGGNGNPGALGSPNWSAGDQPTPNAATGAYYLPNDKTNGGNGAGGSGGGGGGGSTGGTCVCIDCGGNKGGAGGKGGNGGLGGDGGYGGGGAFGIYATGGGSGTVIDCNLNPGNAGAGGNGAAGQNGDSGITGANGETGGNCVCTSNPSGGKGGNGGNGGAGGRGRDGATGLQTGLVQNNSAVVNQNGTTVPNTYDPVTVAQLKGCTNSEVLVSFTGGTLDPGSMGGATIINDLNPTTSSYTTNTSPVAVYFTSTGDRDVVVSGVNYKNFIHIDSTRIVPASFNTTQNNAAVTTICEGTTLNMSTSFTGTEFEWTIVSGTTGSAPSGGSTTNATSHQFTSDGTFWVKLRIKEECCGWSIPIYKEITVDPAPAATITALNDTYCDNDASVTLTGTPSGGVFSGPGVSGGVFNPANANPGQNIITYTTSSGGGCNGLGYDTVMVSAAPQLNTSGLGTSACINDIPIALTGTPAGGSFTGNGVIVDTTSGIYFFLPPVAGLGQQSVTYDYTDTITGCASQLVQTVTVNDTPSVSITNLPASSCENNPAIQLVGSPAGGTFNGQGMVNNFFYPSLAGVGGPYLIEYSYSDQNGCSNVAPLEYIEVFPAASVDLGGDSATICNQSSTTLDAGAGFVSYDWGGSGQTQTISVSVAGTYTVMVVDTNGCTGSESIVVTEDSILVPTITFTGSNNICIGDTLVLDAGANYTSYMWSTGAQTQTLDVTQAGTYTVSVSNSGGCAGVSIPQVINAYSQPMPIIEANGSTEICEGTTLILLASNGFQGYLWSTNETDQFILPTESGSYVVTVTDANGCEGVSAPMDVTVNPSPDVEITASGPTEFCSGGSVSLDAGAGYSSYAWCDGTNGQSTSITESAECSVTVVDSLGCSGTGSISVTVHDPQPSILTQFNQLVCNPAFASYQWYLNGNPIDGATSQMVQVTEQGVYTVVVTDDNGCEGEAVTGNVTPGFDEFSVVEHLNVYPNPNNGEVTLELNLNSPKEVNITVSDITGRITYSSQLQANEEFKTRLDFSNLSKGVYILQLEVGDERLTRRLVRE